MKERKTEEELEIIEVEKIKLTIAEKKRKDLLKKMRKKGILKPMKHELEMIERRKEYWRRFREKQDDFEVDEEDNGAGEIKNDHAGCIKATAPYKPRINQGSIVLWDQRKEEERKDDATDEVKVERKKEGIIRKDIECPETKVLKNSSLPPKKSQKSDKDFLGEGKVTSDNDVSEDIKMSRDKKSVTR